MHLKLKDEQLQFLTETIFDTLPPDSHPDYIQEWQAKIDSCKGELGRILNKVYPAERPLILIKFILQYPELDYTFTKKYLHLETISTFGTHTNNFQLKRD